MPVSQTLSENSKNQLTASESTVDTVLLHNLCEGCTKFFQRWEALEWLQTPAEQRSQTWPYSSFLSTVANLAESQQCCHFCKLLLGALDRWPLVKWENVWDKNVYLQFLDKSNEKLVVYALLGDEQPKNEEDGKQFAGFVLEPYSSM
jgi:hypothetical protein